MSTMDATSDFGDVQFNFDAAMEQHDAATEHTSSVKGRWATTAAGVGIAGYGLSQRSPSGVALALVGGGIAYLGATGKLPLGAGTPGGDGSVRVEDAVTINASQPEVYGFWRDFSNLPRFMAHLVSVTTTGDGRSHWVAKAPLGKTVEWDAEVISEEPGRFIAWRSLEGADIQNTGAVRFEPAPGNRGTVVSVKIEYAPPAGVIGATVAKLFGEEPNQQVGGDLRRFKAVMEAGEIPTTHGQPRGSSSGSLVGLATRKALQRMESGDETLGGPLPAERATEARPS